MDNKTTKVQEELSVRVPDSTGAGVYANIVNVNVSINEIILDFILRTPNPKEQALLASRVIVSPTTAQALSDILEALLRKIDQQKEEKKP